MSKGTNIGSLLVGLDQLLLKGKAPWTLHNSADHTKLKLAAKSQPIVYPKPDGILTFDRPSSVFLSNTNHAEDQPCHLQLKDADVAITLNLNQYDSPEQRYCPAGVYEMMRDATGKNPQLQINSQNCVHCKACDIKDPSQNINWVAPQGGEGPMYQSM
jgi:electron-transferring-flavoprotein dehydrogenase